MDDGQAAASHLSHPRDRAQITPICKPVPCQNPTPTAAPNGGDVLVPTAPGYTCARVEPGRAWQDAGKPTLVAPSSFRPSSSRLTCSSTAKVRPHDGDLAQLATVPIMSAAGFMPKCHPCSACASSTADVSIGIVE